MKTKFYLKTLFFAIISFAFLISCQTEELFVSHNFSKPIFQKISFNQLKNNHGVTKKLNEIQNTIIKNQKFKKNTQNKSFYIDKYDFFIDFNNIFLIEKDNYKSYTFPIYRLNEIVKTENLVIIEENNKINAYIVKYNLGETDKFKIENNQYVDLKDITEIETFEVMSSGDKCYELISVPVEWNEQGQVTVSLVYAEEIPCPGNSGGTTQEFIDEADGGFNGNIIILPSGSYPSSGNSSSGNTSGDGSNVGGGSTSNNSGTTNGSTGGNQTAPIGSGNGIITTPILVDEQVTDFLESLDNETQQYLLNNSKTYTSILNYLNSKQWNNESVQFAFELAKLAKDEYNEEIANKLVNILILENLSDNIFSESFVASLDPYLDLDISGNPSSLNTPNVSINWFLKYRFLRQINPDWSRTKCAWEAGKDIIHLSLDVFGLIPIFGEPADIINGILYAIDGDKLNASLSLASSIPFVGNAATASKYYIKFTSASNQSIKLVWKLGTNGVIEFGSRDQLRKVLNLLPSNPNQAHHIMPWAFRESDLVQKASKSANAFHMNQFSNGFPLPTTNHLTGHNLYNQKIESILQTNNIAIQNMNPDQAYNFLTGLNSHIKGLLQANPNMNLGQISNLISYP